MQHMYHTSPFIVLGLLFCLLDILLVIGLGGVFMKENEKTIYKEIQKNADMAMKAIDAISHKIRNDRLANLVEKQSLHFSGLKNRASKELARSNVEGYHANPMSEFMLRNSVRMNTMLDSGESRVAELLIKGNNMGIIEMEKIVNHNPDAFGRSLDMAKELIELEENSIKALKDYL